MSSERLRRVLSEVHGQCYSKARYPTHLLASHGLRRLRKRLGAEAKNLGIIQCKHGCKGYHIGDEDTYQQQNAYFKRKEQSS